MKTLHIFRAALSGRYYACRAYKMINAERGLFQVTGKKEDVTAQITELFTAQHEATWAMAMEAIAKRFPDVGYDCPAKTVRDIIMHIPCPPLQTTNEECEK